MKFKSVVLDTNVILRSFSNPALLYKIIEVSKRNAMEVVVSDSILMELEEHTNVAAELAYKRLERLAKETNYSLGIKDLFVRVVSDLIDVMLTLRKLRAEALTTKDLLKAKEECGELVEAVKGSDPKDVHVIVLSIKVRPSILLSYDERAFGRHIKALAAECSIEVASPREFFSRFGEGGQKESF